jgi:ribosomal protein L11 methylase PrmA
LDLGSNDGYFSKIAAQKAALVLSFDIDPNCVERQYIALRKEKIYNIVPLILDVMNPEPAIGWNNRERDSIWSRTKVDTIMALALIHHLAIANNVPLTMIASFFAENTKHLIIEWVAKKDEKVSRLLQNRKDIFEDYNEFNFEAAFTKHFDLKQKTDINETRILYYFERKNV